MKPYEYEQPGCDVQMTISPNLAGEARVSILTARTTVYVAVIPDAVPEAALALYEAAGLPEPLILENLPASAGLAENGGIYAGRLAGKVVIGQRDVRLEELDPDAALVLAASLARQALAIKSGEPAPDAIHALADVIEAEDYDLDYESRWNLARSILLGGWKRGTE